VKKDRMNTEAEVRDTGGTGVRKRGRLFDIFVFICSVLIAFVMWLYVMSVDSPSSEQIFTSIPITILEEGAPLSVYYGYNNVVDVTVLGKKSDINKISASDITAAVDIGDISEAGRHLLPVKITLPAGLTVSSQSVNTLSVYLDNKAAATVPVTAKITSYQLAEGYEIGESDIRLSLNEVTVTGPESVLETIASAQAELQLGQVSGSVVIVSGLALVDHSGAPITSSYVTMSAKTVTATVPVYMYKTLPLEVSCKYGYLTDENSSISVMPASIRVKGEVGVVDDMTKITLGALDEKKLVTDSVKVSIVLPSDVTNVDGIDDATVTVNHIGTETAEMVVSNIKVNNPNNLNYELLSDSINVTLRGEPVLLFYISPDDIEAVVDLSYLSSASGTTSVAASIKISDTYKDKVYELGDYKLSVKLN